MTPTGANSPMRLGPGSRPKAPKPLREAVERLESTASELRERVGRGDRKAAARKAARTRKAKEQAPRLGA
jgi:hypothetical protein